VDADRGPEVEGHPLRRTARRLDLVNHLEPAPFEVEGDAPAMGGGGIERSVAGVLGRPARALTVVGGHDLDGAGRSMA
jgi:hypothetical protein